MPKSITPATTFPAIIGRLLAVQRDRLNLDQATVAAAVGVTQPTWSRIERGESAISVDQLRRACNRLGLVPGQLLNQADSAKAQLERQGISVVESADDTDKALAFLGLAALAALIVGLASKK